MKNVKKYYDIVCSALICRLDRKEQECGRKSQECESYEVSRKILKLQSRMDIKIKIVFDTDYCIERYVQRS